MSANTHRPYYYGIDLIRFAAALMVACFHLGWSVSGPGSRGFALAGGALTLPFGRLFDWGTIGVEIFFVISGFVIVNSANDSTPFRFLRSRVERLYPAVWICAPISLLVWIISGVGSPADHLASFAHTLTLFPLGRWVDAPYWSLAHEVIFYGLVFLVMLTGNFRRLELLAVAICAVSATFWAVFIYSQLAHVTVPGLRFFSAHAGKMLMTFYGAFFALGVFIWLHRNGRLTTLGRIAAGIAVAVCLVRTSGIEWGAVSIRDVERTVVWLTGMGALLAASRFGAAGGTKNRLLGWLRNLGLATYPLYLIHFALGIWTMRLLVEHGASVTLAFFATLAMLTALALWVALYAEPFGRRAIRGVFDAAEKALARRRRLSRLLHRPGGVVISAAE